MAGITDSVISGDWLAVVASQEIALMVLTAAALAILFHKTNQPTVIAYLATGLILGPVAFNLVQENQLTSLMSELGLAFLLFFIGLEMEIDDLKDISKPIVKISLAHMALMAFTGYLIGFLLNFSLVESIFIGGAIMFSSTAVVVKLLSDKDQLSTLPGKLDIGILLMQDLVVILLLTFIKLNLSDPTAIFTGIAKLLFMIVFIGPVAIYASRKILNNWFKGIANNQTIFFIHGLTWLFIFINISQALDVSIEIGAFLAGLSIAQIPYSHELKERVRPLTDFFMALFFINIGLQLDAGNLGNYLNEAIIASLIIIPVKFFGMFVLADRDFTPETSFKSSINMVQVSEFTLVLGAVGVSQGIISDGLLGFLSLVTVITIAASTYLINFRHPIYKKIDFILEHIGSEEGIEYEVRKLENHAVVIGYDSMSRNAIKTLEDHFDDIVIVDNNPENVEELSELKHNYIYGDFKHEEIRHAAKIEEADFILSVAPDLEANKKAVKDSRNATVFVKALNQNEAGELYDLGAHYVILKNYLTGGKMSEYIQSYLDNKRVFKEETSDYMNSIEWSDRDV